MKQKNFKLDVFEKFVVIFLAMIIPISVIAILAYGWQIRMFKKNITDNYKAVIHSNLNIVKSELTKMEELSLECLHDENILMLAGMGSILEAYEKNTAMNRLSYHLELLKSNGEFTNNIYVTFPELGRVLDARENLYEYSLNEKELRVVQENIGQYYRNNGKIYRFFSPRESSLSEKRFNFIMIVEYDEKKLKDKLLQNLPESKLYTSPDKELSGTMEDKNIWHYQIDSPKDNTKLNFEVPIIEIYPQVQTLQTYFMVFIVIFIMATILVILKFHQLIKAPLENLVKGFHEVEKGNLSTRLEAKSKDEFGYLYESFNGMIEETQNLIEQVYEQESLVKSAKLKQLQSQINPHFLYNSFFVINNMARLKDTESIKLFSEYLAQYYHFMIQNEEEENTLSEEAEHCRVYCKIHQIRFGERIKVDFGEVPKEYKDFIMPRLVLQPIVENAFEYGLKNKEEEGMIRVAFINEGYLPSVCNNDNKCQFRRIKIEIENNGELSEDKLSNLQELLKNSDSSNVVGEITSIYNTHRRLQLKFGEESGLSMERGLMGGMKISLIIVDKGDSEHV